MTETRTDASDATTSFHAVAPAEPLRRSVALVGALVDECRVELTPDGLRIRAMDPATVAAVDLELDREVFERYEATGGTVGVALDRLGEVLSMAGDGMVELGLRPETRTLAVSTGEFEYTLGLIDPASIRSPPDAVEPEVEKLGELTAPVAELDRAVTAAEMLADHVTLGIDADEARFFVEAEGDTDSFSLDRAGEELAAFEPTEAESMFSVGYLRAVSREIPTGTDLELLLGVERPLYVEFGFADGAGRVRYAVAPRLSRR